MKLIVRSMLAAALTANVSGAALAQTPPAPPAPSTPAASTAPAAAPAPELVHLQPDPSDAVKPYVVDPAQSGTMSRDALIAALRTKVRYVFVVFNENHSFDNEYGTFPGADGLFSDGMKPRAAADTPGFVQHYKDWQGQDRTAQPFLIGPPQNSTYLDSVDHSHKGLAQKIDVGPDGTPKMDGFAADEYGRFVASGGAKSAAMAKDYANLVMSYVDCDTIPFFWTYANRFTIFDNIFATEDTPSTPNAIAMIAGQSGETQWVKHGTEGKKYVAGENAGTTQGEPIVNDPQPFYGSQFDTTAANRQPAGPRDGYKNSNIATNQTYATAPLLFAGRNAARVTSGDYNPDFDLADIKQDIPFITSRAGAPVSWRWYQEGYDHEPTDPVGDDTHNSYVSHHQGPQYFGYLANNPDFAKNMKGLGDLFSDFKGGKLPPDGGVFYIRGGFQAVSGETPPIQNPNYPNPAGLTEIERGTIRDNKGGDDDHPGYSDRQLSEAMAARVVNAVAGDPKIWNQSAIIITYDESDGFYDHVPPRILSYGPDQLPLARGIRIPMIVISPYARAHAVSRAEGDHNAVLETLEAIYDLPALASLPDEAQALVKGEEASFNGPNGFVQHHLGPRDINTPATDDLLSAFEPKRLTGELPPLPASYAMIPDAVVNHLPHYDGKGCSAIGMVPEDKRQGIATAVPEGFNTLPITFPAYNR